MNKALTLLWVVSASLALAQPIVTTQFISETKEDVQEALANPYLIDGVTTNTREGLQQVPGSTPRDIAVNREIYNDIAQLREQMISFEQSLLKAGQRYNFSSEFQLIKARLDEYIAEIENSLKTKLVK